MKLTTRDGSRLKVGIWGSCASYDFVNALSHLYPNIIFDRSYLFRVPTINMLYPPKAFGVDIAHFKKNISAADLINFERYQHPVDIGSWLKSCDFYVIDLFKDHYHLICDDTSRTIYGPEFEKYNLPKNTDWDIRSPYSDNFWIEFRLALNIIKSSVDSSKVIFLNFPGAFNDDYAAATNSDSSNYDAYLRWYEQVSSLFTAAINPIVVNANSQTDKFDLQHEYGPGPLHMKLEFWVEQIKKINFIC